MSQIHCPFCNTVNQIPSGGAGQTLSCQSCKRPFAVPTAASPNPSAPPSVPTVPTGPAQAASPNVPTVPVRPPSRAQAGAVPTAMSSRDQHPPAVPQVQSVHPSVPPSGAIPARPPEAGGAKGVDDIHDDLVQTKSSASLLGLCLLGGATCLVIAGLVLVLILARTSHDNDGSAGSGPGSQQVLKLTPSSSQSSVWSNVERDVVINVNNVVVDVDYVGYGEVRAKDASNRVDQGQQYEMMKFTHVRAIMGHTPQATLDAGNAVEDIVVFVIPSTVDRSTLRYFHLELPAAAYGGSGSYRFEIPTSAIQGF